MKKILIFTFVLLQCEYLSSQITIQNEVLSTSGNSYTTASNRVIDFTFGEVFTTTLIGGSVIVFTQGFQQPARKKFGILDPILVSIGEQMPNGFSIYPNPFREDITVEIPWDSAVRIEIFDNTGRLVFKNQLSEVINTIDLSALAAGNYQLAFQNTEVFLGRISLIKSH
jgi:hypothetical protein